MTLQEAFGRSLPNEWGQRFARGESRTGERFTVVEEDDGAIFFWQVSDSEETEWLIQREPQGVAWWP